LTRVDIPDILRWEGKALFARGDFEEAHRTLTQAYSLADELGAKPQLWPILESLEAVNTKLGNQQEAKANLEQARKIIEGIAKSLQGVGLRDSFLKQPRVQALIRR
jgi:tetratricopeptide (TPR) repeat protein